MYRRVRAWNSHNQAVFAPVFLRWLTVFPNSYKWSREIGWEVLMNVCRVSLVSLRRDRLNEMRL